MKPTPRVVLVAFLVLLVALFLLSNSVHRGVLRGLEEAERLAAVRPVWAMALVVVFSALAAMLAFVSSWVIVPFAVFTWGTTVTLLLLWSGWLLGGATSYAVGRFLGRPAVGWLLPGPLLGRYEERISRHMPFRLLVLVQFALPSEIPGYLLGIVRYSFTRYLTALGLVELVYALVTVYLGNSVIERRVVAIVAGAAALALLTVLAGHSLRRRLGRQERELRGGETQAL